MHTNRSKCQRPRIFGLSNSKFASMRVSIFITDFSPPLTNNFYFIFYLFIFFFRDFYLCFKLEKILNLQIIKMLNYRFIIFATKVYYIYISSIVQWFYIWCLYIIICVKTRLITLFCKNLINPVITNSVNCLQASQERWRNLHHAGFVEDSILPWISQKTLRLQHDCNVLFSQSIYVCTLFKYT